MTVLGFDSLSGSVHTNHPKLPISQIGPAVNNYREAYEENPSLVRLLCFANHSEKEIEDAVRGRRSASLNQSGKLRDRGIPRCFTCARIPFWFTFRCGFCSGVYIRDFYHPGFCFAFPACWDCLPRLRTPYCYAIYNDASVDKDRPLEPTGVNPRIIISEEMQDTLKNLGIIEYEH